jgi:hypothetical protein
MNRKNLFSTIFTLFAMLFLLQSCGDQVHEKGSGNITSETRNVGAFFKLDIEGAYEIVLQEGTNPLIAVETDDNLHQYIETTIDGKTLRIRSVEKVEASEYTRLIITYQNLDEIRLGGAAKISNQGRLNAGELTIRVDGAGILNLSLQAEELDLQLDGAGAVNLSGKVNKQRLELSGAGNVDAFELQSKDCDISLSGFGSAQVFVTDNLNAEVSGVGSIRFKGDPRNIKREVTGLGNIDRAKAE